MPFIIPINYTTEEQSVSKNKVPGGRKTGISRNPSGLCDTVWSGRTEDLIRSMVNRLDVDLSNLENLYSGELYSFCFVPHMCCVNLFSATEMVGKRVWAIS